VVVGGGAESVRAANADGMTWTIDPNARHARDLALGKVMVLTNQSTGRIVSLDHTSAGVVVTLAPVALGEVFKDATFSWHIPISPDQIAFDVAPEPGGNISTPAPGSTGLSSSVGSSAAVSGTRANLMVDRSAAPGATPVSNGGSPGGLSGGFFGEAMGSYGGATGFAQEKTCGGPSAPAPPRKKITSTTPFEATPGLTSSPGLEVQNGNWVMEAERVPGQITIRVAYVKGVRIGIAFRIHGSLTFSGTDTIRNGKEHASGLRLGGLNGLTVGFVGGTDSTTNQLRARVDIPINLEILTQQLFIEGIPFVVSAKPKIIIETAFGANNSTIWTCGDYKLNLDRLDAAEAPVIDTFIATKSLLPINGVSIGVNGVVLAADVKFTLGLGIKTAYAGPFVSIGLAVGATRGSDIGIINCESADLVVTGKAGVGFSLDSNVSRFLSGAITNSLRGSLSGAAGGSYFSLLGLSRKLQAGQSLDFDHTIYAKNLYGPVHKTIPSNVPLCGT